MTSSLWNFACAACRSPGKPLKTTSARRAAAAAAPKISVAQMGAAVLSGKLNFQDLDEFFKDKIALVHTQDYVAQVGQGPMADRAQEHLGRSDTGIILFRKIWERNCVP